MLFLGSGGRRRILENGNLIVSPVSRDDAGLYTCTASNIYGSDESKGRLIVLRKCTFICMPSYKSLWVRLTELYVQVMRNAWKLFRIKFKEPTCLDFIVWFSNTIFRFLLVFIHEARGNVLFISIPFGYFHIVSTKICEVCF